MAKKGLGWDSLLKIKMILVVTGVDERYSVFFWELYPQSEVDLLIDCFWGIFCKACNPAL